ncbi:MAG: ZIP family metal transporter [Caulobacterales bacterium]
MLGLTALATCLSTATGGVLALRLRHKIHLILGFSAGAVVAVALFDLIPEALDLSAGRASHLDLLAWVSVGFLAYMLIDRSVQMAMGGRVGHQGHLRAGSLTAHSVLDGLGIGFAFQVSAPVGLVVAAAVLTHDFSDGVNTVNLSLAGSGSARIARRWLAADALAPIVGIAATLFVRIPRGGLAVVLAIFAGFFLYIGASEMLPESHRRHPRVWTSVTTAMGFALIYAAVRFAQL